MEQIKEAINLRLHDKYKYPTEAREKLLNQFKTREESNIKDQIEFLEKRFIELEKRTWLRIIAIGVLCLGFGFFLGVVLI